MPEDNPSSLDLGQAAAAKYGQADWQLDAEPTIEVEEPEPVAPPSPPPASPRTRIFSNTVAESETPPPTEQIIEAMLFIGGAPLRAEVVSQALRGFTIEQLRANIDTLNTLYHRQHRPYAIIERDGGFILQLLPQFDFVKERLFGGPREVKLTQAAIDVLSLIAYRQPIPKGEIDSLRGDDSANPLRHLVRLNLVSVVRRGETAYGTTPRFLEVFGLETLDDLPQLGGAFLI